MAMLNIAMVIIIASKSKNFSLEFVLDFLNSREFGIGIFSVWGIFHHYADIFNLDPRTHPCDHEASIIPYEPPTA